MDSRGKSREEGVQVCPIQTPGSDHSEWSRDVHVAPATSPHDPTRAKPTRTLPWPFPRVTGKDLLFAVRLLSGKDVSLGQLTAIKPMTGQSLSEK